MANTAVIRGNVVRKNNMQRQQYELVAAILHDLKESGTIDANDADAVASLFADHFADTQDNFKRATFLKACSA